MRTEEPGFDPKEEAEEEDRLHEEDDEQEERDRRETQDDEDEGDIYSDDMRGSG